MPARTETGVPTVPTVPINYDSFQKTAISPPFLLHYKKKDIYVFSWNMEQILKTIEARLISRVNLLEHRLEQLEHFMKLWSLVSRPT